MGIMQRINTNTVVYNYLELRDSIENTTDTFIYLGSVLHLLMELR